MAPNIWVLSTELASCHLLALRALRWLLEFGILAYPCKKHSFFRSSINMFSFIHSQKFLNFLWYVCSDYLCNTRFLSATSQDEGYWNKQSHGTHFSNRSAWVPNCPHLVTRITIRTLSIMRLGIIMVRLATTPWSTEGRYVTQNGITTGMNVINLAVTWSHRSLG